VNLEQRQAIAFFHAGHKPDPDWLLEMKAESPELFGYTVPSRAQLRELPMKFVLWGRPTLVHPSECNAVLLEHDLEECRKQFPRWKADERMRKVIAVKARRTWARLVELATGIRVQISSAPITHATFAFNGE
jgi:hypothetical protein